MTQQERKREFALALVGNPNANPFAIALSLFPDPEDTGTALEMANVWMTDAEVQATIQLAMKEPNEAGLLATKHQFAYIVLQRAKACKDDEVFCKLGELYAKIMGQLEKPGIVNNNTTNITKVLLMPAPLDKRSFSLLATEQQSALLIEGERIGKR